MPDTLSPDNLAAIFKAYDIRGLVPDQIDERLAEAAGAAFCTMLAEEGQPPESVVVGHDMRPSSPGLARAFAAGAAAAGARVTLIGLAATDELYFASGRLAEPGAMFTASHNPAEYNGIKLCRAHAVPVGQDTGLGRIQQLLGDQGGGAAASDGPAREIREVDMLSEYAAHLVSLVPVRGRRLRVVVDAGNGMAGLTAPAVLDRLDVETVPMYYDLDGTFPNHEANPIEPANTEDLRARVLRERADVGLAFDGDADRCFLVDENGETVSPSLLTALIAERELRRVPGAAIIYNLITSRAVPELVSELGGRPVRSRVGHSFIKATMADTGAVFGGEHSGHFYFRDFWRADSGMLAALHALAALAASDRPLSQMLAQYARYVSSGEINSRVTDAAATLQRLETRYAAQDGAEIDHLDGLTVNHGDWWFNVRASNTEPVLRLNAEAGDQTTLEQVRDEALSVIRSDR